MNGPVGTFKTPLALHFLLQRDPSQSRDAEGLFVTARGDPKSVIELLQGRMFRKAMTKQRYKTPDQIRICEIPTGFTNPGHVFQLLEDAFADARVRQRRIERVVIDDVATWDLCCPFLKADETFGDALVTFLEKQGVTTLFVCSSQRSSETSNLQSSILNRADTILSLNKVKYRGSTTVLFSVSKARGFDFRPDVFEVKTDTVRP